MIAALLKDFPWWVVFSLVSNMAIVCTEYLNRYAVGGWLSVLPKTLPLIIVAQFCLFRSFNGAGNWIFAWMVFTVGNSIARVGAVKVLGFGEVSNWNFVVLGIMVMMGGAFVVKEGLA